MLVAEVNKQSILINITEKQPLHRRSWLVTECPITDKSYVVGSNALPNIRRPVAPSPGAQAGQTLFYYKRAAGVRSYAGILVGHRHRATGDWRPSVVT